MPMFTEEQMRVIVPNLPKSGVAFIPYIEDGFKRYGLNTAKKKAMFMAQVAHESGGFRYVRELASGKAYEGRKDLGNITPGDGVKYKGKGLIQITGLANYRAISKDLGEDFVKHPELLETPKYAVLSAFWYWDKHNLSEYADKPDTWRSKSGYTPIEYVTYLINGGQNGITERKEYYAKALTVFS